MNMTEIEARGKIKYRIANEIRKAGENKEEYEDLEIALQVMKEIREYRELGTVEELKDLKEKNEPTKPEFMYNRSDIVSVWKCKCGNIFQTKHKEGILDGTDVNYCCKCGAKFDWKGGAE